MSEREENWIRRIRGAARMARENPDTVANVAYICNEIADEMDRAALARSREQGEAPDCGPVAEFERNEHNSGMMVTLGGELWRLPPGRYVVYPVADTPPTPAAPKGVRVDLPVSTPMPFRACTGDFEQEEPVAWGIFDDGECVDLHLRREDAEFATSNVVGPHHMQIAPLYQRPKEGE